MQVHCDEGAAIRIGPEPCASVREDRGEASAGARTGQPLSRERYTSRAPTPRTLRKAIWTGRVSASARPARRGRRPWHVRKLSANFTRVNRSSQTAARRTNNRRSSRPRRLPAALDATAPPQPSAELGQGAPAVPIGLERFQLILNRPAIQFFTGSAAAWRRPGLG